MSSESLREKHRRKRAAQVLDAAEALFAEQGYEATRIEEIAETASVAPQTVYNYFSTKPNLLMELALRHVQAALPERRAYMARLPADPRDGINGFEHLLARQAMRHLSRECWRIILSAQYLEPGGRAHRTGMRLNMLIRRQYVRLLKIYQGQGGIDPKVDAAVLAELIVGITTWNFSRFIAAPSMSMEDHLALSRPHLDLILAGLIAAPALPRIRAVE